MLKYLTLPAGSILAIDRAYIDYSVFQRFTEQHITHVTKMKKNLTYKVLSSDDRRWQIEILFKQLKQNFPLKYFYGDSVNAIESQIWVTMIANLLLTVIHKRLERKWAFSNMVTMIRRMLMYYIDLYAFLEDPEGLWNTLIKEQNLAPPTSNPQLVLFA